MRGSALFPGALRHEVRTVLAQREISSERRARPVPAVNGRRGKATREEVRRHQEASGQRVQEEEELTGLLAAGRDDPAKKACFGIGAAPDPNDQIVAAG